VATDDDLGCAQARISASCEKVLAFPSANGIDCTAVQVYRLEAKDTSTPIAEDRF
jgi:hypothetical protein